MNTYFDLRWPDNLWQLGASQVTAPVSEFSWHLDCPFWASTPPEKIFDLRPRDVLTHPDQYAYRYNRIVKADIAYPLSVTVFNGLPVVLDGIHRLARHVLENRKHLEFIEVPYSELLPITYRS